MVTPEQLAEARRDLGQQLAARREAAGLTQAQLARLTGYTRSALANVETGRSNQPRTCWVRYDQLLGAEGALLASYDHYASLTAQRRQQAARERERQRIAKIEQWRPQIATAIGPGVGGGSLGPRPADHAGMSGTLSHDLPLDHPEQLVDASPAPNQQIAAPFLGRGGVTIVLPVKQEVIKKRPVVAVEDVTGSQRLAQLARQLALVPSLEYVPADGMIDLNRENLLVVCGPRLSQPVAELLAQDKTLRFEHHRRAWTLVDYLTGTRYRSGQDQTPPRSWDVGYMGRLRRPDRQGSLIVLTGIHPPGTLGVIEFLSTEITTLFAEVKTDTFSLLVGTHFNPGTLEPREVTLLTPIRRLETG